MNIGVNTWGLSKEFKKDFSRTLDRLKEIGVEEIEPCFVLTDSFNLFKRIGFFIGLTLNGTSGSNWFYHLIDKKMSVVKEKGLNVKYVHLTFIMPDKKALGKMIPTAKALALKYNIKGYVISLLPKDISTARGYLDDINSFNEALKEINCKTIYHNHSEEMNSALDFLMDSVPDMYLEFDVGWSVIGEKDPLEIINKYNNRINIIHFKDVQEGEKKDLSTIIGEGSVDLKGIIEATKDKYLSGEIEYIIDQDASKGDIITDLQKGIKNIEQYL